MTPEQLLASKPDNVKVELCLTEEQDQAIDTVKSWLTSGNPQFKLGGYAGTGKTTLIKYLLRELKKNVLCCAFTGKACHVLNRKGVPAQTIHSLIYNVIELKKGEMTFELKQSLESSPNFIIIDEASMISGELYKDLCSFNIPLLFIGDPGQLEPIGDNPNLMKTPDFVLSKILRQEAENPIIKLATDIRLGGKLSSINLEQLVVKSKAGFGTKHALTADQIICAKNKTRCNMNLAIRNTLGHSQGELVVGDKIICLRNNRVLGIFNGQIFFVEKVLSETYDSWKVEVRDELDNKRTLPIFKTPFKEEVDKDLYIPKQFAYCDYAYVITCHKSQGSEWDNVIVYDEWMPPQIWDMKRWRYTAITRAAKKLTYLY